MTNDDRIGQKYAEADHTIPGLMRWHYRKRPDTVARIRQLPLSLYRVQSNPYVCSLPIATLVGLVGSHSLDKNVGLFIDFMHRLRSALIASTRPAHIPSASADSSSL